MPTPPNRPTAPEHLGQGLPDRHLEALALLATMGRLRSSVLQCLLPEPFKTDGEPTELRRTRQALRVLRALGLVDHTAGGVRSRWFLAQPDDRQ